jgi:hypothetical protein
MRAGLGLSRSADDLIAPQRQVEATWLRRASALLLWRERERQRLEWIKTVPATDYAAIIDGLRALRRSKEALNVQLAEQFSDRD